MAETSTLSWDDLPDENFTEDDVKGAEAMGKLPLGRFLCTCVQSLRRQKDFNNYSCTAANLKWRVDRVLELGGVKVEGDEADGYIGRFMFDDVNMSSPEEKDGMRQRRIFVAKRTGLIANSSGTITAPMWATGIIGNQTILTNEDQTNEKTGKVYRNVAFYGYEAITDAASTSGDDYSDL